jgi:hypothetical protein
MALVDFMIKYVEQDTLFVCHLFIPLSSWDNSLVSVQMLFFPMELCMQVAASVAYKCRALVAYIDTCHSFSSIRVAHMVGTLMKTSEGHQVT